ncbi:MULTISPECIES: SagB/ThcOx family dehydrogenase [unclassified Bradyrhizobium]|uniref:SagB/ThcOx family dehydrogenase n=1 Tax=unclassified Bradyrhizobium TaxID=2631580 RepID=UPI00041A8FB0|nr:MULTISPECIES: SagB family peptide dehydrogenase [unclassified Bradyrhizobium]QIG91857.1 SagB/ThcOx family dehydrogenase [Bradyrhizobium sp. 6(2017)]
MRASRKTNEKKKSPRAAPPALFVRLNPAVALEAQPDGAIAAHVEGYAEPLGTFSTAAVQRARKLGAGLPLPSSEGGDAVAQEVERLMRQLARRGLLEYRLARAADASDLVVIEPQIPDYWPRTPKLDDAETVVLSRFAYLRRRGTEMVLESPRAGALLRICDERIAALLTILATPQKISRIRRLDGYPGPALLALLLDCQILIKVDATKPDTLRQAEGDDGLVLWDFHDLLFHARSTEGRQASPLGGLYPHTGLIAPLPAIRPAWPGNTIKLPESDRIASPLDQLLHDRHSTREFDDQNPIRLAELSMFLNRVARVRATWSSPLEFADDGPDIEYTSRPYPAAGSAYELELYLAVANCDGLTPGFYHYDADAHALAAIDVRAQHFEAMMQSAGFAMDAPSPPQILITIAARFGRISWKYSAIAYALILKDVGVLTQTLYLVATDLGLGGCAIGTANIDLFAKMTGLDFHVEGPVGQFALGRGIEPPPTG